jgi:hypothetical protein
MICNHLKNDAPPRRAARRADVPHARARGAIAALGSRFKPSNMLLRLSTKIFESRLIFVAFSRTVRPLRLFTERRGCRAPRIFDPPSELVGAYELGP